MDAQQKTMITNIEKTGEIKSTLLPYLYDVVSYVSILRLQMFLLCDKCKDRFMEMVEVFCFSRSQVAKYLLYLHRWNHVNNLIL